MEVMKGMRVIRNWRADVVVVLVCVTMVLMLADGASVADMLVTKAAAVLVGGVAYGLFRRWDAEGHMEDMKEWLVDEA